MLESSRKGASVFVYVLFGILIAAFVYGIAPTGGRQGAGCGTSSNAVVEVDGANANVAAYHIAYSNHFNRLRSGSQRKYFALDTLIRREILADAAAERGMRVTGDMVDEEIKKGNFFLGGLRIPLGANIFDDHPDGTRTWNVRKFKGWVNALDVRSTSTYRDEQVRSMQAALMYELLASETRVSREEALSDFLFTRNTVAYDMVTFSPGPYKAAMRLDDASVDRYLAAHEADVKARYTQDERLYKGMKPQYKLRSIFIAKAEEKKEPPTPEKPAPDQGSGAGSNAGSNAGSAAGSGAGSGSNSGSNAGSAAGSGAGSGSNVAKKDEPKKDDKKTEPKKDDKKTEPPKAIGMPIEEAKTKLEAARADIAANKMKFEDAAKKLATDDNAKLAGGYLGWRTVENAQLGDKAVNEAVKAIKPGEMTPVITTANGVYLVMAEDKREGDLDYDKVKHEIAADLAKDGYAKEAAKRAALASMKELLAGTGKNIGDVFEREAPEPNGMPNLDFMNDPNMSEEQKKMILEQLQKSMQQNQKSGAITWESKDIPVKWEAGPDGPSGSAGSASGSGTGSAAKGSASGSGAGSAAKGSGAGSAKGSASGSAAGSAAKGSGAGSAAKGSGAGSATGSAAKGSASGSGAGGGSANAGSGAGSGSGGDAPPIGSPPKPGVTTVIPPVEATADKLPDFADVPKPKIVHIDATPRRSPLPGLSKELTNVLFDELSAGNISKQVYEVEGSYVIFQISAKGQAKVEDFEKDADRYVQRLQLLRSFSAVEDWIEAKCKALDKDKKIIPAKEFTTERGEGSDVPETYKPCMYSDQWLQLMLPALGFGGG